MAVHVQVHHRSARVVVEIHGELDAGAVAQCLAAYDRGQISGWKEVTVVLRDVARIEAAGIELLLYLQERARQCRLRTFGCDADVNAVLAAAGLAPQVESALPAAPDGPPASAMGTA